MKKWIRALSLAMVLALSVTGCATKSEEKKSESSAVESSAQESSKAESSAESSKEESSKSENSEAKDGNTVDIQILATSDMHGKMIPYDYATNEESTSGSVAQVATIIKQYRNDNTLVIDAGDIIQDNSADLFLKDEVHPMILGMNKIGYDIMVTGNHEYNYGMEYLKACLDTFKGTVLTGNVWYKDGTPVAKPYTIVERGGVKIGVIGMVTPNIVKWDSVNLEGCKVTDPVEETKKAIKELEGKVDVMIGVMHMGLDNEYDVANSGVIDMANACPELAVIVAAHEHKLVEGEMVNNVLIVENKNAGQTVAKIDLVFEKGADGKMTLKDRTAASIAAKDFEPDADLLALFKPFDERAKKEANTVIGKLEGGPLAPPDEIAGIPQATIQDTAMIDLINEVQLYYTGADVSAAALFNAKSNLPAGDIKKSDVSLIYKYTNTLYKMEMTGAQLKKYMEWSASFFNTLQDGDLTVSFSPDIRLYNYDMFAGVNYDLNVSKEPGSRIENLTKKDGTPVKDDDVFVVAVNNYRAGTQLMSYGTIFKEGEDLPKLLEMDVKGNIGGVRELIADYIINVKGGTIEPHCDNNWKLTGINWNKEDHEKVVQLVKDGKLTVPTSEDGRTPNVKSITVEDIKGL